MLKYIKFSDFAVLFQDFLLMWQAISMIGLLTGGNPCVKYYVLILLHVFCILLSWNCCNLFLPIDKEHL